jgi:hypothetical protein
MHPIAYVFLTAISVLSLSLIAFSITRKVDRLLLISLAISALLFAVVFYQMGVDMMLSGEAFWPTGRYTRRIIQQAIEPAKFYVSCAFILGVSLSLTWAGGCLAKLALSKRRT